MSRKTDQFFKEKLGDHIPSYKQEDWNAFASMLDKQEGNGADKWLWFVFLFILLSFLFFIPGFYSSFSLSETLDNDNTSIPAAPLTYNEQEVVRIEYIPEDARIRQSRNHHSLRKRFDPAFVVENENRYSLLSGHNDFGTTELFDSYHLSGASDQPFSDHLTERGVDKNIQDLMSVGSAYTIDQMHELPVSSSSGERNRLSAPTITPVDYSLHDRFSWGAGLMLGNQSLTDLGVFLEMNYALFEKFGLSFRPGGMYKSGSGLNHVFNQQFYDFGQTKVQIELESTAQFQIELPVFLSIQSNRHRFALGGGLLMDIGERFKEKHITLSDNDRVARGSSEKVIQTHSSWTRSSLSSQAFIEACYQYHVHPGWHVGLRSRIPLNNGVMLTYMIN
jgi:hypothetical protein